MEAIRGFLVLALIAVCIGGVQAASLKDDMVVYLKMDEGQGLVTKDESGNGNDGEVHNAEWTDGVYEKGLKVGGMDIWVSVPDDPTLNFAEGESLTLAIWTKRTGPRSGCQGEIVAKYNIPDARVEFYGFFTDTDGTTDDKIRTYTRDAGSMVNLWSKETINDEKWHHVALVRDANSKVLKLYVDGDLNDEAADTTKDLTNPDSLVMGRHYINCIYDGIVDELMLWRRALSGAEIQQAMKGITAVDPGQKLSISWGELKSAQ